MLLPQLHELSIVLVLAEKQWLIMVELTQPCKTIAAVDFDF